MRRLLGFQGIYYFLTGVWPLLHMPSFLFVTGPKTDLWLVTTVGAILAVSGIGFFWASFRNEITTSILLIAGLQAYALGIVDFYYALNGVIAPVYLLDGVPEFLMFTAYVVYLYRFNQRRSLATSARSFM
jgi:hypothetical protein